MKTETGREMQALDKRELETTAEGTREGLYWEPPVDIYETPEALFLEADMPGVAPDGVEIDLREGVLTLVGRQDDLGDDNLRYREYRPGNYLRRFSLAETIDQEGIEASMSHGVLSIRMPKVAKALPRRITVNAS